MCSAIQSESSFAAPDPVHPVPLSSVLLPITAALQNVLGIPLALPLTVGAQLLQAQQGQGQGEGARMSSQGVTGPAQESKPCPQSPAQVRLPTFYFDF